MTTTGTTDVAIRRDQFSGEGSGGGMRDEHDTLQALQASDQTNIEAYLKKKWNTP